LEKISDQPEQCRTHGEDQDDSASCDGEADEDKPEDAEKPPSIE
jgi:hypothetical protein